MDLDTPTSPSTEFNKNDSICNDLGGISYEIQHKLNRDQLLNRT